MIEVENVSRFFGDFCAVNDISFSIPTGEIVGLLGPNGAGKTTTMRMITGFLEPSKGSVKIDGIDVVENPVEAKKKIGYMPENAPVYADMIVSDYLEYVAKLEGCDPQERIPYLANICGLREVMHKNIGDLSRGNKQRVGLAHALMDDPEILILDEPTSGLDPNQVMQVRSLIKKIGETRTVIISTHILSEVEALCNRVIIISGGKKIADNPTVELQNNFGKSAVIELCVDGASEDSVKNVLSGIDGISSVTLRTENSMVYASLSVAGEKELRPEIARVCVRENYNLYEMQLHKSSLEDVFRTLTKGEGASNE